MNVLVKAIAGSHLFGTNTERSDLTFSQSNDILVELFGKLNEKYLTSGLPEQIDTRPILLELYGNIYKV